MTKQQIELLAKIKNGDSIVCLHWLGQGLTDELCAIIRALLDAEKKGKGK
jgi:hypothetical protein